MPAAYGHLPLRAISGPDEIMTLALPKPIELYFAADNGNDPDSLDACLAADAIVRDEARPYKGLAAIKRWKTETKRKYNHTTEPLRTEDRGGTTVVQGRVTGSFPGSPIVLRFSFTLSRDRIGALEIGG
jgi:SnoaL-like domain